MPYVGDGGGAAGALEAVPESDDAEPELEPEPESELGLDEAPAPVDEPPLPRKSVTYQPEPLSWKPAAVTCFWYVLCPHSGQTVKTGSDIFCSTSCACPQALHR